MDDLTRLFDAYDRGTISRRQLFQALGLVAVAAPFVPLARAFGQGQCAGRDRDTTAACNKTPFKAPFEPTGWKTVLLDHFTMQVTDAEREAAFYAAFLGWKVRSNDGNEIYMDIGDWGGVKIRGGYAPPARGGWSRRWRGRRWRWCSQAVTRRAAGAAVVAAGGGWRWWPWWRRLGPATIRATWPRARRRRLQRCRRTAARSGTASAGASRRGTRTRSRPRSRRAVSIPSPITAATTSAAST